MIDSLKQQQNISSTSICFKTNEENVNMNIDPFLNRKQKRKKLNVVLY